MRRDGCSRRLPLIVLCQGEGVGVGGGLCFTENKTSSATEKDENLRWWWWAGGGARGIPALK